MRNYIIPAVVVLFLVFPVVFNLFHPGYFVSDDGEWMVIRFSSFYQEIRNGQFPVRFLHRLNDGYGYPVATFLYPGFMYVATIFKAIGFGFITSIKLVFLLSVVSAFVGSYFWLSRYFSRLSSIVGAAMYIYHPYFLWDIYKRGSVGEVLVLGIAPFLLYFLDRDRWVFASILGAFSLISHNTLALFIFPLSIVYYSISHYKKIESLIVIKKLCFYVFFSLGISSFFWVPAVRELKLTIFDTVVVSDWRDFFVRDIALAGWLSVIIFCASGSILFHSNKKHFRLVLFMMGLFTIGVFLASPFSSYLWSDWLLGRIVQFPFRFLSVVIITTSFLAAYIAQIFLEKRKIIFSIIAVSVVVLVNVSWAKPSNYKQVDDAYYQTNEATTTVQNEYMPVWVRTEPSQHASVPMERLDENTVQINTIYWPGYEASINNRKTPIDYSNAQGLMRVTTTADTHDVSVRFRETPFRLIADFISLASCFVLFIIYARKRGYV